MCVSISYMCPLPETVVTCDSHDTDNVWLISPWYKLCDTHDTGAHWYKHDTATSDTHDTDGVWPLLPDTIMTLPNVTHDTDIVRPPSTWYNHDTATCDTHDIVWPLLPDTNMTLPQLTHILQTWTHLYREVNLVSLGLVFLWFKYIYLVWLPIISCLAFAVSWQLHCKKTGK